MSKIEQNKWWKSLQKKFSISQVEEILSYKGNALVALIEYEDREGVYIYRFFNHSTIITTRDEDFIGKVNVLIRKAYYIDPWSGGARETDHGFNKKQYTLQEFL